MTVKEKSNKNRKIKVTCEVKQLKRHTGMEDGRWKWICVLKSRKDRRKHRRKGRQRKGDTSDILAREVKGAL